MTGVIIGRFMPPHVGHQYLMEFARGIVDTLYVFVCTLEKEPIPGELRYLWVCELAPQARVVHITEEIPEARRGARGATAIWAQSIRTAVDGPIDYVFASEQYGFNLAAALEARFFPVDPDRRNIPVSASLVRQAPYEHWRFIPPVVRPYFVRHVVLIDNKALARSLADALQTVVAHPYRDFWDHIWKEYGQGVAEEALGAAEIARGERAAVDALARQARGILIHDLHEISDLARLERIDLIVAPDHHRDTIQKVFASRHDNHKSLPPLLSPSSVKPEDLRRILLEPN